MTTHVYYRKWRPDSFSQLVGQEHVATTLRQSIMQDRVSHSYLFCGPRGSGKTTTARVLAKAINCLDTKDGDPCNACSICISANEGRFLDIIEMDAASNRGIDEIRDIRDKVNFSPVQGRRKAYIIDEAHMLTDAASNAFLKTLEEPPDHVIFILCTTEAQKILPTIISRCQRFDFRRIPSEVIYQRLSDIADAEGASVDQDALRLVSRYAAGSLRDAENLLEQLVVSYSGSVGLSQVEDLLGLGHSERWLELVKYLLMGNTSASLGVVNQAAWDGTDMRQLHRQTQDMLRAVMLTQWGSAEMVDQPDHVASQLKELVGQLPPWRILKAIKLWGAVNMRYDAPSTLPLELAIVEICDDQLSPPPQETVSAPATSAAPAAAPAPDNRPAASNGGAAPSRSSNARPRGQGTQSQDQTSRQPATTAERAQPAASNRRPAEPLSEFASSWVATVRSLGKNKGKKYNLGALLRDCKAESVVLDGDTLVLPFSNRPNLERMQEEMEDPNGRRLVAEAVEHHFGNAYQFRLTLSEENGSSNNSQRTAQNSPLVRAALGMGARIIEESVE